MFYYSLQLVYSLLPSVIPITQTNIPTGRASRAPRPKLTTSPSIFKLKEKKLRLRLASADILYLPAYDEDVLCPQQKEICCYKLL